MTKSPNLQLKTSMKRWLGEINKREIDGFSRDCKWWNLKKIVKRVNSRLFRNNENGNQISFSKSSMNHFCWHPIWEFLWLSIEVLFNSPRYMITWHHLRVLSGSRCHVPCYISSKVRRIKFCYDILGPKISVLFCGPKWCYLGSFGAWEHT